MTRQFSDYKVMRAGSVRVLYARGGRKTAVRVAGLPTRETYPKFKALLPPRAALGQARALLPRARRQARR